MNDRGSATASGGTGLLTAGGLIIVLIAAAAYLSLRGQGEMSADDAAALVNSTGQPVVRSAPLASAEAPGAVETSTDQTVDARPGADPQSDAPRVDEVRVDASGMIVVAGRASPGGRVDVVVDGEVVSSADADATGAFAALGRIAASDVARSLTLRSGAGADEVRSGEEIILAPVPAPASAAVVAEDQGGPDKKPSEATVAARVATPTLPAPPERADIATGDSDALAAPVPATSQVGPVSNPEPAGQATPVVPDATAELPQETPQAPVTQVPVTQIQEPAQGARIAVLRSDTDGVSLLQTEPADRVVLDTIGYSQEGVVQLSGRASSNAVEVRAYLNNRPVARLPVGPDGSWRGDVPEILTGVYNLRIDALGETGVVTSRLETPFKREAPEVLAAATKSALRSITVQTGDTLWAIARERYGEGVLYVQVFEANRAAIRNPDLIYPGQVFDLPAD